jgi:hypothetical protein
MAQLLLNDIVELIDSRRYRTRKKRIKNVMNKEIFGHRVVIVR